ncbi:hypothetical protein [Flavonifractor plautii]|uniref:Uncharacterized protein n=1 Tax=Flavonifractor plautii TaxID=292800 RepID=A0AAW6CE09_FLAPL|nr:hypothetical protein [Flavonifractor plautii]MDB7890907.1 hypothetical protein [Flavonifractor plautii]MDB7909006.1 hypothetical protein [Flavonifractor plautii]
MVWKITPELQTAIDHVSEQKVAQKAGEFLEQAIKHISDGTAQLGTQQPQDGKNICFKPLVKQGSQDTLLIAIPERAFKAYNYSSFREAASEAIAHVQHNRMTFCPGGACFQHGFDLQQRPLSFWSLDEMGQSTAFYNVSISDVVELQQAHWLIEAQRVR